MAKKKEPAPTRNVAFYVDDFDWFSKAAEHHDRSRVRMMRHVISQWKAGQSVLLTITKPNGRDNGK